MMQLCGECTQQVSQVAQVLMNPATWLVVGSALMYTLGMEKKKKETKK